MIVFDHEDLLSGVESGSSLLHKLQIVHDSLRARHDVLDRIAVAIYDEETRALRTLVGWNSGANPLVHYECLLSDAPSLELIASDKRPRLVQDLSLFDQGTHLHTHRIAQAGFRSSYTVPIIRAGSLVGFVFFNSRQVRAFDLDLLEELDVWAHLIGGFVVQEKNAVRMLVGAIKTASDLVHSRDPETYGHLQRMARYARLIAAQLAETGRCSLTDEEIERIFWFAPMHDLGKIGIPDAVLMKRGKLEGAEKSAMREHSVIGAKMLDQLVDNFGLRTVAGVDMLRDVALKHHEALDGSGYPNGLKGEEIPLSARIVAVADIFDALTTRRPYKAAWPIEEALAELQEMAKTKLDRRCVDALIERQDDVRRIHATFAPEEELVPATA